MLWKFTVPKYNIFKHLRFCTFEKQKEKIIFKNWGGAIQTNGVVCIKHFVLKLTSIAGILAKYSQILRGMHIIFIIQLIKKIKALSILKTVRIVIIRSLDKNAYKAFFSFLHNKVKELWHKYKNYDRSHPSLATCIINNKFKYKSIILI